MPRFSRNKNGQSSVDDLTRRRQMAPLAAHIRSDPNRVSHRTADRPKESFPAFCAAKHDRVDIHRALEGVVMALRKPSVDGEKVDRHAAGRQMICNSAQA